MIIGQPLLALPLALLSHFICDAIPHWRVKTAQELPDAKLLKTNFFRNYLITEAALCFLIVVALIVLQPNHWLLASFCAFVAASPDLVSICRYRTNRYTKKVYKPSLYEKFAGGIQWFERPIGAVVEAAWLTALLILLIPLVK